LVGLIEGLLGHRVHDYLGGDPYLDREKM
jgi:hypothetical protein